MERTVKSEKATKLDWSKMLGFDQLAKVDSFKQTMSLDRSGLARVGLKNKPKQGTKLNWSKMLGFDQLAKVDSFKQTMSLKRSGLARVGVKGGGTDTK